MTDATKDEGPPSGKIAAPLTKTVGGIIPETDPLLQAYRDAGWFLFPLQAREKIPLGGSRGHKDAVRNLSAWRTWIAAGLNLGLACEPSGVAVVDLDGPEGRESWESLRLGPPATPTALTGGAGTHFIFSTSQPVPSKRYMPGLDVKSRGGYVVLPPSVHPNGRPYLWEVGFGPGECGLLPFPETLATLATRKAAAGEKAANGNAGQRIVDGEGRHNALIREAGRLHGAGWTLEAAIPALTAFATEQFTPPFAGEKLRKELDKVRQAWSKWTGEQQALMPTGETTGDRFTERGLAEHFAAVEPDYAFDWTARTWRRWDGRSWAEDENALAVSRAVTRSSRALIRGLLDAGGGDSIEGALRFLAGCESLKRHTAILTLAREETVFTPGELAPHELPALNGILDMETGGLAPHDRARCLTQIAPVTFDPDAKAPGWTEFTARMFPDEDERWYCQRLLGYLTSGERGLQSWFMLRGPALSSKTTFSRVVRNVLGPFTGELSANAFVQRPDDSAWRYELPGTRGRRLLFLAETERVQALNEAALKSWTGCDVIVGRAIYAPPTSFVPTAKLVMLTNFAPTLSSDPAIWRRTVLFPRPEAVPEREIVPFDKLVGDLTSEAPGILNWICEGYRDFRERGLAIPPGVTDAFRDWQSICDTVSAFLNERTVSETDSRVGRRDLYGLYCAWVKDNGLTAESYDGFYEAVLKHPGVVGKLARIGVLQQVTRVFEGLRIV